MSVDVVEGAYDRMGCQQKLVVADERKGCVNKLGGRK